MCWRILQCIYICSVEHSATNFPQYEQYDFRPNFAATLHGQPSDSLDDAMPNGDKSHESFDFSAYKQSRKLWMDLFEANGRRGKDICA